MTDVIETVGDRPKQPWGLLIAMMSLEALGAVVLAVATVRGFLGRGQNDEFLPALSIVIVGLAACAWVVATWLGALRRQGWARGSALTMQVLILAVSLGAFQGEFANPMWGWLFLLLGGIGLVAAIRVRPAVHQVPEGDS